jgi:hypothetical protein
MIPMATVQKRSGKRTVVFSNMKAVAPGHQGD